VIFNFHTEIDRKQTGGKSGRETVRIAILTVSKARNDVSGFDESNQAYSKTFVK
jgi:hypothetical protein